MRIRGELEVKCENEDFVARQGEGSIFFCYRTMKILCQILANILQHLL